MREVDVMFAGQSQHGRGVSLATRRYRRVGLHVQDSASGANGSHIFQQLTGAVHGLGLRRCDWRRHC